MASALSRTAWTMTSTSRLVIERIDSRSSRSARPIIASFVVTSLLGGSDTGRVADQLLGVVVVDFSVLIAGLAAQDQRVAKDGDGREDEPLDRVAEMRAFVENGLG